MAPSISIREYIRWLPDKPSEPTQTLVLTSRQSRFVDIRILRPIHDVLHLSRLDWAFAGTSSSQVKKLPDGQEVEHSTWRHWIDSRSTDAEEVTDEGDMYPSHEGIALERGAMVNPATGKVTEYEEAWRDVPAIATATSATAGDDNDQPSQNRVCAVLILDDDARKARGTVVRIGQFCGGLLRVGDGLSLERWKWSANGGWQRQVRMGDLWIPCGVLLEEPKLRLGGEVRHGEQVWRCVEMEDF